LVLFGAHGGPVRARGGETGVSVSPDTKLAKLSGTPGPDRLGFLQKCVSNKNLVCAVHPQVTHRHSSDCRFPRQIGRLDLEGLFPRYRCED
jgi:hypothetical protein